MSELVEFLQKPWPWYVAGPLIGLSIPVLLILGNKSLGISSSMKHICASCIPSGAKYFQYKWKSHAWNLIFSAGVIAGGVIGGFILHNPEPIDLSPLTIAELSALGFSDFDGYLPSELFSWESLTQWRGVLFLVLGGILIGFGTRYAEGCTSGHSIFGISTLQWPSLVATVCFFLGGLVVTHFIYPLLF